MRKRHFITDLKGLGPNSRFQSAFLVQTKEVRQKKSGDPFLSLRLADRTGSLDSKMWDNVAAVAETFEAGDFVDVRGKVQVFNGQHQIIAHKLTVVPEDEVFLGDFVPHTDFDVEAMYAEVLAIIDRFSTRSLRRLMRGIFLDPEFARLYKRAPAARGMHHAKIGGLLEHVTSVLKLAMLVASHYRDLNSDLLACGVLMHDVGKIFELTADRSFDYTDEGRLLGHISIGSEWLSRRCDEVDGFPPRLKTLLLHMVVSHHGKLEYGSPQVPLFPEALALHFIDDLDSKLEMMRAARADMAEGTIWSPYHKGLNRFVLDKVAFLRGGKRPVRRPDPGGPARRRKRGEAARTMHRGTRRGPRDSEPVAPIPSHRDVSAPRSETSAAPAIAKRPPSRGNAVAEANREPAAKKRAPRGPAAESTAEMSPSADQARKPTTTSSPDEPFALTPPPPDLPIQTRLVGLKPGGERTDEVP